tara:strand:+ start:21 stop:611 length:591 start_codon:yes stop_codon:yes gene_type:complete
MSEIRVTNIIGETGTDAVNFSKGINISSGIVTATSFSGSGSALTGISAGKVLQVVQNLTYTRAEVSATSYTATTHQVSITPTAANSKILINFASDCNNNGNGGVMWVTVYRSINGGAFSDIAPNGGTAGLGFFKNYGSASRNELPFCINYLDSPSYSVGNAIIYKLYIKSGGSTTVEIPHAGNHNPCVNMATEIAA